MKFLEKHITVTLCSRGEKVVNLKCHKHLYGWQRGNQIDFFFCRKPLFEDRKNMLTDLYKYLLCPGNNDHFLSIMSIRKGRKLVARVLPLLEKVRLFVISLLRNLTATGKSKIICNQFTQKSYPSLQEKIKLFVINYLKNLTTTGKSKKNSKVLTHDKNVWFLHQF